MNGALSENKIDLYYNIILITYKSTEKSENDLR